jgi:hypothetical protein
MERSSQFAARLSRLGEDAVLLLQQIQHEREVAHSVFGEEVAGAGLYVQFGVEPLCKLVGCFRRDEDIRV